MANIKITTLGQVSDKGNGTTFKDMHFDLKFGEPKDSSYFTSYATDDAVADYDINAIKNSLFNIFNTAAGEKILDPLFGASLQQFLFLPITSDTGTLIGDTLQRNIQSYEPRVTIRSLNIYTDVDNNQYVIDLELIIPRLKNSTMKLAGILSNSRFTFI